MTTTPVSRPWDALQSAAPGSERVFIAAPYIKEDALRRLLLLTPPNAALTCVTRWQRHDVAVGASDVECRSLVAARGGRFLLHQRLHAKYYRLGDTVLVGSANLTAAGMGYSAPANTEILCSPGLAFDPAGFERALLADAREVDDAEFVRWQVIERFPPAWRATTEPTAADEWRPLTREPANVWLVYAGRAAAVVSADESTRARQDLEAIQVPSGLDRPEFDAIVSTALLSSAGVADVLRVNGLPDDAAWTELASRWDTTRSVAQRSRETAWNWIATFLDTPPPLPPSQ